MELVLILGTQTARWILRMIWLVGSSVLAIGVACLVHLIYKWYNPKCNGVLPPGSMGLPFIGESLQLLEVGYSFDVIPFLRKRIRRYGPIFRTSVAGRPVVVSADPSFNHYIFQQDGKLFDTWYLDVFDKLFDKVGAAYNVAHIHKYIRITTINHFGLNALKDMLLPQIVETVHEVLHKWSCQSSIDVKYASASMALNFGAKQLISYDPQQSSVNLTDLYASLLRGLMSFPLKIPGTPFHKCMKDRTKAMNFIREVLKQRLVSPEKRQGDFLDHAIQDMNANDFLTKEFIVQLFFGLMFVTYDAISTMTALTLKLLDDSPDVLEELTVEHEEILSKREKPGSSITWDEYKSMAFTQHVINEVLRLGNITPGLFRRTLTDIQVNGYTIPAGWPIMIVTSALHLNSEIYNDPLDFNPSRWKDRKSNEMTKNFMPFGEGMKQCAGAEYTKVFMASFLHVLVTKYRWTIIKGGGVCRNPFIGFGKGLHIKVTEK